MPDVRRVRGDAFFFIARFTTEFVVSWDGTVAGKDLHLTEDGLVSETRLVCQNRREKTSEASQLALIVSTGKCTVMEKISTNI